MKQLIKNILREEYGIKFGGVTLHTDHNDAMDAVPRYIAIQGDGTMDLTPYCDCPWIELVNVSKAPNVQIPDCLRDNPRIMIIE